MNSIPETDQPKRNWSKHTAPALGALLMILVLAACPTPTDPNAGGGGTIDDGGGSNDGGGGSGGGSDGTGTGGTPDDGGGAAGNVPQFFWGSWVRMDGVNEQWYVSDSAVTVGDSSYTPSVLDDTTLQVNGEGVVRRSENTLTVASGAGEYYLFRRSGANAQVQAGVRSSSTSGSRSILDGLSGIRAIVRNINNPSNEVEATTGTDGTVEFDEVIPGDEYELEVPVQEGVDNPVTVTVTPEFNGENIGFVTLTDAGQNFKVGYQVSGGDEWGYLYAGESYDLTMRITNVGSADMLSADYEVTVPAGLTLSGDNLADIMGTVQADGGVRELSFTVSALSFTADFQEFEIPISITSIDGLNRWEDQIQLRFYRETMSIHVRSETNEVQGVVIAPDGQSFPFQTSSLSGSITVPAREVPYTLALSGAGYESETKYALRINEDPLDNGSSNKSASTNEPNNDESQATAAHLNSQYLGYLGIYDLDFYSMNNATGAGEELIWSAINPAPESTVATTTPVLSWARPLSVSSFELQVAESEADLAGSSAIAVTEASYTPSTGLAINMTHYWRVRARNAGGEATGWSPTYSFTVGWGEISGMSPADAYYGGADTAPEFDWDDLDGAVTYEIAIADSQAELETAAGIEVTESTYSPSSPLTSTTHYWRVRAKDAGGHYTAWSTKLSIELTDNPSVGDLGQAGGIVFYDKGSYSDGWRFLEAAPSDQSSGIKWGGSEASVPTGTAIGTGEANTNAIVAALETGSYAARVAYDYEHGGYDDWFLPSRNELNQLYAQRSVVGLFGSPWYWSSSEVENVSLAPSLAWTQYFVSGNQLADGKQNGRRVRAVRSF